MKKITPYVFATAALVLLFFTVMGSNGLIHLFNLRNEVSRLQRSNDTLEEDIATLHGQIFSIENSSFDLEKKAREELGLSRKDEIVYIFSDRTKGKTEASQRDEVGRSQKKP